MRYLGLWGVLLCATGVAQTEIQVRALPSDEVMAPRGVYVVDFIQQGAPTRGQLVIQDVRRVTHVYELELSSGARKRVYLNLELFRGESAHARSDSPRTEWRDASGEVVRLDTPKPAQAHLPLVVVGTLQGGLERLNGQRIAFASVLSTYHEANSPPLRVYYWRPEEVPEDWRALLELPVIVLVDGVEQLRPAQVRALRIWLASGGTLCLAAEAWRGRVSRVPLVAELLPHGGSVPSAPFRSLLEEAGKPVAWERRVGLGRLCLFAGDLSQPEWRASNAFSQLMLSLVSRAAFPSERLQTLLRTEARGEIPVRYQRVWIGLGVVAGYIVAVWGLTAWLRRRRRLVQAFVPLAVLTVIGGGLVALTAPRLETPPPQIVQLVCQSEMGQTVVLASLQLHLPRGIYEFTLPEEALVLQMPAYPSVSPTLRYASARPTMENRLPSYGILQAAIVYPIAGVRYLELRREGAQLHLRNLSPYALQTIEVQIRYAPDREPITLAHLPQLGAGQTAQLRLNGVRASGELWVRAGLPHDALPKVAPQIQAQEVNYLFAFVP